MLQAFDPSATDKELDVSGNLLTGSLPGAWGNASLAQGFLHISLGANFLAGTIPDSYGALLSGGARRLRLEANNLEGMLPASWLSMASAPAALEAVSVASNPCLCGSTPSWFNASNSQTNGSGLGTACVTGATCAARQPAAFTTPDAEGGPHALTRPSPCSAGLAALHPSSLVRSGASPRPA
jgi:hypothetical protein